MDKNKAQIFPQPYPSAPCDSFSCTSRATWFIGRPDGPLNICLKVCDNCLHTIAESLPDGFKPIMLIPVASEPTPPSPEPEPEQEPELPKEPEEDTCPVCKEKISKQGLHMHMKHKHPEVS